MPAEPHTTRHTSSTKSGGDPRGWKNASKRGEGEAIYRRAVSQAGSIRGTAKLLDVSRATVREQMALHDIANPQTGEVPRVKGVNKRESDDEVHESDDASPESDDET